MASTTTWFCMYWIDVEHSSQLRPGIEIHQQIGYEQTRESGWIRSPITFRTWKHDLFYLWRFDRDVYKPTTRSSPPSSSSFQDPSAKLGITKQVVFDVMVLRASNWQWSRLMVGAAGRKDVPSLMYERRAKWKKCKRCVADVCVDSRSKNLGMSKQKVQVPWSSVHKHSPRIKRLCLRRLIS
jgi:hypothetical protein